MPDPRQTRSRTSRTSREPSASPRSERSTRPASRQPAPHPPSSPPRSGAPVGAVVAAGLLAATAAGGFLMTRGQSNSAGAAAPASPVHVLVAADVSRSMKKEQRERACEAFESAVSKVLPPGVPIRYVFYDRSARVQPGLLTPETSEELRPMAEKIAAYPSREEKGTRQSLALRTMRQEADRLPDDASLLLVLMTDGEDQDPKSTKEEVAKLADDSRLRGVWVVGAEMEARDGGTRRYLRDALDKSLSELGERRRVTTSDITDADLEQLKEMMAAEAPL